ncbi:MAG TPA: hypothetical protein VKX28_10505 [Xanthobacteraceae bacterium]|jgi:hypothetical protein|nr:hypothetical protein [Xanthobacteraceae bacterium]
MPRFHFHLRAHRMIHRDVEGTDLPDLAAARAHAADVARELMAHSDVGTRHWSIYVEDAQGERQFDLLFPEVDARLGVCSPEMRMLAVETCRRMGALIDAFCAARATQTEARILLARARGRPQLVYAKGT